ncbi:bifunctional phosphopantothenoylcysteine decarboxylase/phosphopantothenate--cysteine ligase CoaBC [Desulfolithobacter sp.]
MPSFPFPVLSSLAGRRILLGVTGSIAVYKTAQWVRDLVREEARVTVVMTSAAVRFITPLTMAALSGSRVYTDMFDEDPGKAMAHIDLSREHDLLLVAPATAHTISRLAHGMADDLLTTTVLAAKIPVVVCPAMNSVMFAHPATRKNLDQLCRYGYRVVEPESGMLACGEEGAGRLPGWGQVREVLLATLSPQDLQGRHVLVTAGPTREPLDPARYLSNRSSGRMGYALARVARRRGARVTLVSGPVSLDPPPGVELVPVMTAREMRAAVLNHRDQADIIIMAAAVADFRPADCADRKIKKSRAPDTITLSENSDILRELGRECRPEQVLVGFAAESHDHEAEGRRKLVTKNLDLICVNDILGEKTGFDVDTNQVLLIDRQGQETLPLLSKEETAVRILDRIRELLS